MIWRVISKSSEPLLSMHCRAVRMARTRAEEEWPRSSDALFQSRGSLIMVLYHLRETPMRTPMAEGLSGPVPMIIWARSSIGSVEIVRENGMVALSSGKAFVVVKEVAIFNFGAWSEKTQVRATTGTLCSRYLTGFVKLNRPRCRGGFQESHDWGTQLKMVEVVSYQFEGHECMICLFVK